MELKFHILGPIQIKNTAFDAFGVGLPIAPIPIRANPDQKSDF